jgi:tripartite-type tricarboxylate transporter receptor subunit TctC
VVVNKTGAAGAVGMSFVANTKPDGYTLLMALSSISIIPEADKLSTASRTRWTSSFRSR